MAHLKDVLHAPQVATDLVSLRALDANGRGYVGRRVIISMLGGKLRFRVRDKLYKLEGFPGTKNTRREMTGSGNVKTCNQHGSGSSTANKSPDQANRAVVASGRTPPE